MKIRITLFCLACFAMLSSFGQNDLTLTLVKDNDEKISNTQHFYLLEVKNNTNSNQVVNLVSSNEKCSKLNESVQVNLNHEFLSEDKNEILNSVSLSAQTAKRVFVKISRPNNTTLNRYNCSQVYAQINGSNSKSKSLTIKTFVPDPRDDN